MHNRTLFVAIFCLLFAVVVYFAMRTDDASHQNGIDVVATVSEEIAPLDNQIDEYGVPLSQYRRIDQKIRRNQTFSDLLIPHGVPYETIVELANVSREVFDVRRLRTNQLYRVYLDNTTGLAEYLVYEQDRIRYIVFSLGDSLFASASERTVTVKERTITGVITASFYESLLAQGASPVLANELSEVYAWQIDFYRIQRGDHFRIIYDEIYVGDERIDIGTVHAARFNHIGNDYFAFHYGADDIDEYYDEAGASLRKAFLIAPVRYSRISSGYTGRRFHPIQKIYKAHLGTDYVAPYGTPIRATGDGVVEEARFKGGNGNWVKIRHNGTYSTGYLHMSRIAKGIRPGVRVEQRQVIGYVGHSGLANGDHVCYRFWKNGQQVNHRRQKIPSLGPIPDAHRSAFEDIRDAYLAELSFEVRVPMAPAYAMLLGHPVAQEKSGP